MRPNCYIFKYQLANEQLGFVWGQTGGEKTTVQGSARDGRSYKFVWQLAARADLVEFPARNSPPALYRLKESVPGFFFVSMALAIELELELIQNHMTQPLLRVEGR